ncbi:MAG: proton-conducting transporter membrane subunit [Dehalococcoidia bacterium]
MAAMALAGSLLILAAVLAVVRPVARLRLAGSLDPAAMMAIAACAVGSAGAAYALATGADEAWRVAWAIPGGALALHVDPLAAVFLLPVLVLGGLAIPYGHEYWAGTASEDRHEAWAWFYLFLLSMALVILAANAVLFLIAWESMSVAAFFLVNHEDHDPTVRQAAWTFLIAAHLGTAFLLAMFTILGGGAPGTGAETLDFAQLRGATAGGPAAAAVVLLALAGFGTKAGLVPGHVWLPAAHPAAPSHVSAVLSGAMLKTGIYGLLRVLTLLPVLPSWTGWLLISSGLLSGLFGIVFAIAQRDLKRLLADSSIENLGVIVLGVGIGVVGVQHDAPMVAALGFSGALLHVLNHALFKGLLFLGAGSVLHATGERNLDVLGGLLKRMPWTGGLFLIGAAAIAALPPLNGFASEFLLYSAALEGVGGGDRRMAVAMLAAILGLALIGGLVAATYLRAALAFTGEPRSEAAAHAHESGPAMRTVMLILAAACVVIGLVPMLMIRALEPAVAQLARADVAVATVGAAGVLTRVTAVAAILVCFTVLLSVLRARLLAGRSVRRGPVWSTAYLAPAPSMQYSGASFVQPLTGLLSRVLGQQREGGVPPAYFPSAQRFAIETPGLFREYVFVPAFRGVRWIALNLRWMQHGRIQLYLVNIAATLLLLLVWKLGFHG